MANIALNKTYLASSELDANHAASKAFDSSNSSFWSASDTSYPQTLQIDFGGIDEWFSYSFSIEKYSIVAQNGVDYITAWDLQGSTDGSTWNTVVSETGQAFTANEEKIYYNTDQTRYRYWRLNITAGSGTASIAEFKILKERYLSISEAGTTTYNGIYYENGDIAAANYADKKYSRTDQLYNIIHLKYSIYDYWYIEDMNYMGDTGYHGVNSKNNRPIDNQWTFADFYYENSLPAPISEYIVEGSVETSGNMSFYNHNSQVIIDLLDYEEHLLSFFSKSFPDKHEPFTFITKNTEEKENFNIYSIGGLPTSGILPLYIYGDIQSEITLPYYEKGLTSSSGIMSLCSEGGYPENKILPIYIHGHEQVQNNLNLYMYAANNYITTAYEHGHIEKEESFNYNIHGHEIKNDEFSGYEFGVVDIWFYLPAIKQEETIIPESGNFPLSLHGKIDVSGEFPLYELGPINKIESFNLYQNGYNLSETSLSLYQGGAVPQSGSITHITTSIDSYSQAMNFSILSSTESGIFPFYSYGNIEKSETFNFYEPSYIQDSGILTFNQTGFTDISFFLKAREDSGEYIAQSGDLPFNIYGLSPSTTQINESFSIYSTCMGTLSASGEIRLFLASENGQESGTIPFWLNTIELKDLEQEIPLFSRGSTSYNTIGAEQKSLDIYQAGYQWTTPVEYYLESPLQSGAITFILPAIL